jgi:hypothetical protein
MEGEQVFKADIGTDHGAAQGTGKAVAATGTSVGSIDIGHRF